VRLRGIASVAGAAAAVLIAAAVFAATPEDATFSERDLRSIVALGPWPVDWRSDPSNRASGRPAAIAFGEALFLEPRLSGTGAVSCASCHRPERSFTDGQRRAAGIAGVDRNTPSLANVRLQRWFGWDGAADNLWAQSLRPMLEAREMGGSVKHVATLIRDDAALGRALPRGFRDRASC
jgi:cytochrome c peroxidase